MILFRTASGIHENTAGIGFELVRHTHAARDRPTGRYFCDHGGLATELSVRGDACCRVGGYGRAHTLHVDALEGAVLAEAHGVAGKVLGLVCLARDIGNGILLSQSRTCVQASQICTPGGKSNRQGV